MIRVFNIFCKIKNFLISAAAMYEEAIKEIDLKNVACPYCNTKDPAWSKHATYLRYLYSPEDIIAIARNINRVQINNGDWYTTEVSKTDMKLLETLGIHL